MQDTQQSQRKQILKTILDEIAILLQNVKYKLQFSQTVAFGSYVFALSEKLLIPSVN